MVLFSEIPRHNQMDVLKKLDFQDFVLFRQCSQETVEMTKNFRHGLKLHIYGITFNSLRFERRMVEYLLAEPVRLEIKKFEVFDKMTDEQSCILKELAQKTKLVVNELHVVARGNNIYDPEMIDNLIKLLKVKKIFLYNSDRSILPCLKELENIEEIQIGSRNMKECDFLLLKQPVIHISYTPLSPSAISTFLKEWLERKREIKHLSTNIEGNFMEAFNNIKISILWSPESAELNIPWRRRLANKGTKLWLIYSIEREMDKKQLFIIILEDTRFRTTTKTVTIEEYKEVDDIHHRNSKISSNSKNIRGRMTKNSLQNQNLPLLLTPTVPLSDISTDSSRRSVEGGVNSLRIVEHQLKISEYIVAWLTSRQSFLFPSLERGRMT